MGKSKGDNSGFVEPISLTRFERLTTADCLSHPVVNDVIQDSNGYLWFATGGVGPDRYDGYNFKHYREDAGDQTSLPFDDVQTRLRTVMEHYGFTEQVDWRNPSACFPKKSKPFMSSKFTLK